MKVIIPVAGLGIRLYPETQFIKKALLPVYNNGKIEPALSILLREVLKLKEIDTVLLVVDNIKTFEFFRTNKVQLIEQNQLKGLGDAIYQCKDFIKDDYYMLLLGDMIYNSKKDSCCKQLLDFFNKKKMPVMGLKKIFTKDIPLNGMVDGTKRRREFLIDRFVEKPQINYAKKYNIKYGVFGNYILPTSSFSYLETMDLYQYLEILALTNKFYGYIINGKSFDIGVPENYYNTFVNYHKS